MHDVYIVRGLRTPIGRYGGALSAVRTDDLAAHPIRALLAQFPQLPPSAIDEVVLGCANQAGEDNRNVARMATLLSGLPPEVPATTINRLCGSGLDAIAYAARGIQVGEAELVIAGGVESMSRAPFVLPKASSAFSRTSEIHDTTIGWRFVNPLIEQQYGVDSMPQTAENVAVRYGISRADQDAFALRSQDRALQAQESGRLAREIAPVTVPGPKSTSVVVDKDEHPRKTSLEKLSALAPLFPGAGTVTAGNASGVNDGAAALLLASRTAIETHQLTPIARIAGFATAGVAPAVMGVGPVPAIGRLLDRHGLAMADIDAVELNEAFAAQALACLRQLGLADDAPHVNRNGGAIALGHPLGMSGARIALTAAIELSDRRERRAIVALCVGVGQGIAMLLEGLQPT